MRARTAPHAAARACLWIASLLAATNCGGAGVDMSGTGGSNAQGSGGSGTGSGGTTGTGGAGVGTGGAASGGRAGTGGRGGSGGRAGSGGSSATGGSVSVSTGGSIGAGGAASLCVWPAAVGANTLVTATIPVSGVYDGGMKRFVGSGPLGTGGQLENQDPLFEVANGATLQNVILGAPASDGVHCAGTCTLKNVWWEDVGEDAATSRGAAATTTMTIDGGGANHATDKVFQHNGGGTMVIRNFCAQDFGKLYRSCGNCTTQYARHVQLENLMIIPRAGSLVGVNTNYMDTATFKSITIRGNTNSVAICERYTGNATGAEPVRTGAGADGTACVYAASDITWQ